MGWKSGVLLLVLPPILVSVILWRTLKEPLIPRTRGFMKGVTLSLVLLTFVSSMRDLIYRGFTSFLPSYFVAEGSSLIQAGMITGLTLVSGVIAQPLGGTLSDKIGRKRTFVITLFLLTISLLGFTIIKGGARLAFLPLIGLGVFTTFPVTLIYASELAGLERTGTSVGFVYSASQLIASFGPLFTGYVIDRLGFTASFYSLVIFSGAAFAASFIIPEARREQ
jgi:FSR family fosmidomycin resistance protein-like MFS transporter